jgi:hypothetical protein
MAAVFGRARVAGQVIWAARFKERWVDVQSGGGGPSGSKGGPRTTSAAYSLSFAVAVCEGPIDGIGRVWADGKPMDMAGVVMRVHTGAEDQAPDPLIAAVEGDAPAYRGTAYVVFEDLPLGAYGNRPPQLSFEVFHRPRAGGAPAGLEERLKGVCLIPGAGEFVYATDLVLRRDGLTRTTAETLNNTEGRPDLVVSLDQLQAQLPNVEEVTLVVAWFGDDLRCGSCADPAQGRAGGQGDDPVRVAGERRRPRRRCRGLPERRRPGLWRHAGRPRGAAGHRRAEAARTEGDALSVRADGRAGRQYAARPVWRRGPGGLSVARPDHLPSRRRAPGLARQDRRRLGPGLGLLRRGDGGPVRRGRRPADLWRSGRRLGPAADAAALRKAGPAGRRGGRLHPGLGAARPDHGARRGLVLSGRDGPAEPGRPGARPAGTRDQAGLRRRLERVFRAPAGGRLRRRPLPSRSAVERREHRFRRRRLLSADGRLARRRRPSGRRAGRSARPRPI